MAKGSKSIFVCQSCGDTSPRWQGKCASCGEWNSLVQESNAGPPPGSGLKAARSGVSAKLESLSGDAKEQPRFETGIGELDRVAGGGIVPGSAILIGGEPGIGKSTLLLQVAARVAEAGKRCVYFSGEEATAQVRLRAKRLGLSETPVALAAETNLANILQTLKDGPRADLIIVDSIQTLWSDILEAAPGTVSQVRAATQSLIRYAKAEGSALLLVGHVTKDGNIAGPKVVEHMVDAVFTFEGDQGHAFRILRAAKNRFGATDEMGVFEMRNAGLIEVANPSELFLGDREQSAPGSAVFAGMEGTRPILVEIQALVAPSSLGTPRRAVVGWEANRLAMVLAVLQAHCGVSFADRDVYLNVAGGLRIGEPAADLAAAAALLSSFANHALPTTRVFFGEVSLSGAIRASSHTGLRLKEAHKLGFKDAVLAEAGEAGQDAAKMSLIRIAKLRALADQLLPCQ